MAKTAEKKQRNPIPQAVRFDVLRRDNFTCRYCGKQSGAGVILHLDHRLAVAKGGTDHPDNLVTACSDCNFGKGVKDASPVPIANVVDTKSIVGWFGYRLRDGGRRHHMQFEIMREIVGGRYLIQLFSYFDGCPSDTEVVHGEELFSDKCKLYPTEREWVWAACVDSYKGDKEEKAEHGWPGRIETPDERFADWLSYRFKKPKILEVANI